MTQAKIHLLEDNKEAALAWDEYVKNHPSGSFYQQSGWKIIFESVFSLRTYYFYALDDAQQICGVCPVVLVKNIFGQKFLTSSPFMSFCGLCADDSNIEVALIAEIRRVGNDLGVQYVELRQSEELSAVSTTKNGYVSPMLELSADPEVIWKERLNTKVRNKIRQAERRGVTVETGHNYMPTFYEIFAKNMRGLGTPTHPARLFDKILEVFGQETKVFVARVEETVIAGMILFGFAGRTLHNPWSASLDEFRNLRPNNAMYWEALKYGCENGYMKFDFGRSTVDTGTYQFKLQWGAVAKPLYYQYLMLESETVPQFDANNNKYQKVVDVWKKLPLKVTNYIGPKIVRHLPEL